MGLWRAPRHMEPQAAAWPGEDKPARQRLLVHRLVLEHMQGHKQALGHKLGLGRMLVGQWHKQAEAVSLEGYLDILAAA